MTEPAGLLLTPSGESFATGAASYLDAHPDIEEPLPRIYVEFLPEGTDTSFVALLDTGGHYCILSREVVDEIGHRLTGSIGRTQLRTAYGVVRGELYIHTMTLIAEVGIPVDFEAIVFVPSDWRGPCILGYTGALDRLCLALNPQHNRILFGPLK